MENKKYPKALILIHWLTFVLVMVEIILGIAMEEYSFDEANFSKYRTHAIIGIIISLLTIIRLFVRQTGDLPPEIEYYSRGHRMLVTGVRHLIYTLLIIAPVVGFVMMYQAGVFDYLSGGEFPTGVEFNETLEEAHKFMVFALAGLVVVHVGGVMMYGEKTGKKLLRRMCHLMK